MKDFFRIALPLASCPGEGGDDGSVILFWGMSCVSWMAYLPPQQKPAAAAFGIPSGILGVTFGVRVGSGDDGARIIGIGDGIRIDSRIRVWKWERLDRAHESRHARGNDGRPVMDEEGSQGWNGGEGGGDALCRAEGEVVCLERSVHRRGG